jgi:hypothetical protein
MAVYAALIQTDMLAAVGTNAAFNVHYGIVDTVALTGGAFVAGDVLCPMSSPGTWEGLQKDAVIASAAVNGYTLPLANIRWYPYVPGDFRPVENPFVWTKDITKTNIPATFTNVYVGIGGEAQLGDFFAMKQYRLVVFVNKVGTGTQDAGLMDTTNAANFVMLSDTAAAGEHILDSGWLDMPAWMTGEKTLKPVARSTVITDDPIYRGFALYTR